MCKIGLVFLFSIIVGSNYAQGYFVLLQSGNRQPFYARLGTRLYSSTPGGHLILSQLKDSTYEMSIGFPSQPGVEQNYALTTSQKDQEFEIRDRGEAGWGLYDALAKEWITAVSRSGGREEVRAIGVRRDDAFSRMMAGVVHDTAVLYNDYANTELPTSLAASGAGSPVIVDPTIGKPSINTNLVGNSSVSNSPVVPKPGATKPGHSGAGGGRIDTTMALVIPVDTQLIKPDAVTTLPGRRDSATAQQLKSDIPATQPASAASRADGAVVNKGIPLAAAANATPPVASVASEHSMSQAADTAAGEQLYRPISTIVKVSERKLAHNMRLVYADRGKEAGSRSDTVVVLIPLDSPQPATAKRNVTASDSVRITSAKAFKSGLDSGHITLSKGHISSFDTSHAAASKVRNSNFDSGRAATAKVHNSVPDSNRGSVAKSRLTDSIPTPARSKGPNDDTPSNPRLIVSTPAPQIVDKAHSNDSVKKSVGKGTLPYINSDCHAFASDYDVDKLRVKMLEVPKDEDRIAAALKIFKAKCFFTRQLKALSEVFTTDASKYRFWETAYPFAADEHFRELGALLTDPIYVNKFKALTH
jgi:hypothetical protein